MRQLLSSRWSLLPIGAVLLVACDDGGSGDTDTTCTESSCYDAEPYDSGSTDVGADGGADGAAVDASESDAAATGADAHADDAAVSDGGQADSAPSDAGELDASATDPVDTGAGAGDTGASNADAGAVDTGAADTGTPDAGTPDAGTPDAGTPDTGTPDAGTPDTGTPDTGTPDAAAPDGGTGFVPVRFDLSDHAAHVFLSSDRLSVENRGEERGNARSDGVVTPGSGVFYFEAERLIESTGVWGVGVATSAASLAGELAADRESLGLQTYGQVVSSSDATCSGSENFGASLRRYGFVIDYRGANPRIHVILENEQGEARVQRSCSTTLTAPLHIFYAGVRYEVGYQLKINAGSDTTNFPFHFSESAVRAALTAAGEAAAGSALVAGFGQTRALPLSASPVLVPPANLSVGVGANVQLTGTASDPEDGDLTSGIVWTDLSSQHHTQLTATGPSFGFTPSSVGRHPIRMSATDSVGRTTAATIMVTVTGTLPSAAPVQLAPDAFSAPSIVLSGDGLQARFEGNGKFGIRANQAIFGQYWYFEAHRNSSNRENMGIGIVIPDGSLAPYDFVNVPWSCSINLLDSVWRNLISQSAWDTNQTHYGFAVDYTGLHPLVHIIIGGLYHSTITMDDVWGPVHPMVYGDPPNVRTSEWDISVNFGANLSTSPFQFNPAIILSGRGIGVAGLELGWGN